MKKLMQAVVAVVVVSTASAATEKVWKGGASGSWSDDANWTGGKPEASDLAVFSNAGEVLVEIADTNLIGQLRVDAGTVTLRGVGDAACLYFTGVDGKTATAFRAELGATVVMEVPVYSEIRCEKSGPGVGIFRSSIVLNPPRAEFVSWYGQGSNVFEHGSSLMAPYCNFGVGKQAVGETACVILKDDATIDIKFDACFSGSKDFDKFAFVLDGDAARCRVGDTFYLNRYSTVPQDEADFRLVVNRGTLTVGGTLCTAYSTSQTQGKFIQNGGTANLYRLSCDPGGEMKLAGGVTKVSVANSNFGTGTELELAGGTYVPGFALSGLPRFVHVTADSSVCVPTGSTWLFGEDEATIDPGVTLTKMGEGALVMNSGVMPPCSLAVEGGSAALADGARLAWHGDWALTVKDGGTFTVGVGASLAKPFGLAIEGTGAFVNNAAPAVVSSLTIDGVAQPAGTYCDGKVICTQGSARQAAAFAGRSVVPVYLAADATNVAVRAELMAAFDPSGSFFVCRAQELTPDAFVCAARRAYPGNDKSLVDTNAMKAAAFFDRRPGLVRWIDAPSARNVRDIGGWTGLRTGRAFRGTQLNGTEGRGLTRQGLERLRDGLGIRTDLDLRRTNELGGLVSSPLGPDVRFVHAPIEPYENMFKTPQAYAKALRVFADERNYPVYFHCWGGADRTGLIALLLESLCGVDEVDVQIDYELTTFAGFPRYRDAPYFRKVLDWVRGEPGKTLSEKAASFVARHFGLSDSEIAAIRRNLAGEAGSAVPVWVSGAEAETNAFYGFSAVFQVRREDRPVLRLAAGSVARVWLNGTFAGYGPARAAEGYMRIDEWPLGKFVRDGRNVLAVEVANASVNTLYQPDRPAYLLAEVVSGDGRTLAATGRDFRATPLPKVRKVNRFSYQRGFGEYYRVTPADYAWRTNGVAGAGLPLSERPRLRPLGRGAPYPDFAIDGTFAPTLRTRVRRDPAKKPRRSCSCVLKAGQDSLKGFPVGELEVNMLDLANQLTLDRATPCAGERGPFRLEGGDGVVFVNPAVVAGFPRSPSCCVGHEHCFARRRSSAMRS